MDLFFDTRPGFEMVPDDDPRFEPASDLLQQFRELRQQYLSPIKSFGFQGANSGTVTSKEDIASSLRLVGMALQDLFGKDFGFGQTGIRSVTFYPRSSYAGRALPYDRFRGGWSW